MASHLLWLMLRAPARRGRGGDEGGPYPQGGRLLREERCFWGKRMGAVLGGKCSRPVDSLSKAKEAQDDLVKTKEELQLVMTAPPPPPPPVYEPVAYHVRENLQEEGTEDSGYSAELSSEGILDDRNEEKRVTEAEKNLRVQQQLMVRAGRAAPRAPGLPLGPAA